MSRFPPGHNFGGSHPASNFTCTLIGHISDQFIQDANFTLAPNSFKFDIHLDNLEYADGFTNTTYALVALVEGTSPTDQGQEELIFALYHVLLSVLELCMTTHHSLFALGFALLSQVPATIVVGSGILSPALFRLFLLFFHLLLEFFILCQLL